MVPEGGGGEGPSRRAEGADGRWRAGKRAPRGAERAREASDDRESRATHPSISKVARAGAAVFDSSVVCQVLSRGLLSSV